MSAEVLKITTEEQYEKAVEKIEALWESKEGTPEFEALMHLIDAVHDYENVAGEELLAG